MTSLAEKAEALRALHRAPPVLVLPNAWDVASARIFASFPSCRALATTSAGVAAVLGYPDGELIPRDEMLELVGRIARAVDLPVTADLEAGYGDAGATAEAALEAGAVGLNLEDAAGDAEEHVERIRAARSAGVSLVVNARVDLYILRAGEASERFDATVDRARRYLAAGADCIFVPGVEDAETIGRLARAIDGPLNVLAGASTPPVSELERLGVARVSVGSGAMRASLTLVRSIGEELLERGSFGWARDALPFADAQRLVARGAP